QDDAADEDVLPARELRMEAGAQLDQRGDAAFGGDASTVGPVDPGDQADQRALSGAVSTDDADGRSAGHAQAHALHCCQILHWCAGASEAVGQGCLERRVARPQDDLAKSLGDVVKKDCGHAQSASTNVCWYRAKIIADAASMTTPRRK